MVFLIPIIYPTDSNTGFLYFEHNFSKSNLNKCQDNIHFYSDFFWAKPDTHSIFLNK